MNDAALVVVKHEPLNAEAPLAALRDDITPTHHFYVRSHFALPPLLGKAWKVRVGGSVGRPFELTEMEIRALPARTIVATLECAGGDRNRFAPLPPGEPWGFGAIGTASWRGAALRDVLARAGIASSVVEVLFEGADQGEPGPGEPAIRFARSLPLAKALDPDTLLAYEMNGEKLSHEHGGPIRLVAPDWYGVASVKWLESITVIDRAFAGFYQARRYVFAQPGTDRATPVSTMRVKSLITSHEQGIRLGPGRTIISGAAWSGDGAIVRVEVAVDGTGAWQEARLLGAARPHAWRRWEFEWEPLYAGRHVLRVRATDEHGHVQPDAAEWNTLGYGNNSIQQVVVEVAAQH